MDMLLIAETHNFLCAVAPYPGKAGGPAVHECHLLACMCLPRLHAWAATLQAPGLQMLLTGRLHTLTCTVPIKRAVPQQACPIAHMQCVCPALLATPKPA